MFGAQRGAQGKKREGQRGRKNSSGRMHTLGEPCCGTVCGDSGHKHRRSRSHSYHSR
jgi:hypothetical protein